MSRDEVAHVVRAAANITGDTEFILIGFALSTVRPPGFLAPA
jgi:hypothetical protein